MMHAFLAAAALALPFAPAALQDEVHAVEPAELGQAKNVHRAGSLWFAGQFEQADIEVLKAAGIARVISVRTDGEVPWDERGLVEGAGLDFVNVPFRDPELLSDAIFGEIRALLRQQEGPTLLHCGSANRAGAAWLPFRVLDQGVPVETALAEAREIGMRTPHYEGKALAYIERQSNREKSVKEGINDNFKDADLDVDSFVERFEVESREVYAAQKGILAACQLKPGQRVADVGAGTGLYTLPFAQAVGATGWVWAVDIAPRFLQHIGTRLDEAGITNVSGVLCSERSIDLPPASVDLAFVCDTYHHFEYPRSTLASILSALRPGGRFVLVEFHRIEGVTSEWLLGHVRADQATFRGEIEAAGFRFVEEVAIEGLSENYLLVFQKPE